jgi:cytochrome aa3 quinol oxidase subunit IV
MSAELTPQIVEEPGTVAGQEAIRLLQPRFAEAGFPWPQIWGFAGSLVLTFSAFYLVARSALPPPRLFAVVLVLAGAQALLQLGAFLHVRESRGPAWQVVLLALALLLALGLVGLSMWVMTFKWGVS